MIRQLKLLRNIGQFDSVNGATVNDLESLVLIYGENGKGKTTLVAILRSLETGNPLPIMERRRLSSQHLPHVVLDCNGDSSTAIFRDNAWNCTFPDLVIFDDVFVHENVHSGLEIEAGHRQKMHELVLGAQGVELSLKIKELVGKIEQHNSNLRQKSEAFPKEDLRGLSIDDFCALNAKPQIEKEIQETKHALAAARQQIPVRDTPGFPILSLPEFQLDAIEQILSEDLPTLDAVAAARVQQHIATLNSGGEKWLSEGMNHLSVSETGTSSDVCPFCAQDLTGSPVIAHYRGYFSEAYADLKRRIKEALCRIEEIHTRNILAEFERKLRLAVERRQFWSQFCEVPEIAIDTEKIVKDWDTAQQAVVAALLRKQAAPLEAMTLEETALGSARIFQDHCEYVAAISESLIQVNQSIESIKRNVAESNPEAIEKNLKRLQATKARHLPDIADRCDEYLMEKQAKIETEKNRDQARIQLNEYTIHIFPKYQNSVNDYLSRFGAGFRIDKVKSRSNRAGSSCTYNALVNHKSFQISGGKTRDGEPSFRNTLSAGDRNTLALAFFLAALKHDCDLARKVVILDDPVSSLDDHRSFATVQEIRKLAERDVSQVIVLSHDKRFLCRLWDVAKQSKSALEVVRDGCGSKIRLWDVTQDCLTEHDCRNKRLHNFIKNGTGNTCQIAMDIRPYLESLLRITWPEHFQPGTLLGHFLTTCRQQLGKPGEIFNQSKIENLEALVEYANRFHHDRNAAWESEIINDTELKSFIQRTLDFRRY